MYQNESNSREDKVIKLWNQQMQTYKTILINKPNIVIPDNEKGSRNFRR